MSSLKAEERETIISWNDDDGDNCYIYSSQQPMIRRLLKNKLFECKGKRYDKEYTCHPNPISIEGVLPLRALTIRRKLKQMSLEQKEKVRRRFEKYRESQNDESN